MIKLVAYELLLLGGGYGIRYMQEYRFFARWRRQRKVQAEVAVDTARMLTGLRGAEPHIDISPLIRQYLEQQRAWRETVKAFIFRYKPYQARHSGQFTRAQQTLVGTSTEPLSAVEAT